MHIGLIGLGKMGNNMRTRLRENGIEVTGFDRNPDVSDVPTLAELAAALPAPRVVWVMVPSGPITTGVITDLAEVLEPGDLVIEGGNSRFTDDFANSAILAEKGINLVNVGQVMLVRRILPCQWRLLRMWEFKPEGRGTLHHFFGTTHEGMWKLYFGE